MKRRPILYFILLTIITITSACSDLKKGEYLNQIEEMNSSLDSISIVLKENEIDTLSGVIGATMQVELRIKNYYYADTIDMELGKKMDAFKRMKKRLPSLGNLYSSIRTGVEEQQKDLALLKGDIENGNGERKKYGEYVQFEQEKVGQLRSLLREYVNGKNESMKTFNELYPELNAFSLSLLDKPNPKARK